MINKVPSLGALGACCAVSLLAFQAIADDWIVESDKNPAVKVCVAITATGPNVKTAIFPVATSWTIDDCRTIAGALKADRIQLGCFQHPKPDPRSERPPYTFGCSADVKSQQCTKSIEKLLPSTNCDWAPAAGNSSKDNKSVTPGADTGKHETSLILGPEWIADPLSQGVKVCLFAATGWSSSIPVTSDFVQDDCANLATNTIVSATITFGCYWPRKEGGANPTYSWGIPGKPNRDAHSFSKPSPNCGW
jgi:hypothetical protein